MVNWNTRQLLLACLTSVYETIDGLDFEIWVVDNGSQDGSAEAVQSQLPAVNIIKNTENLGFAAANNQAFQRMKGRYAVLLNTDTVLTEGAIRELYVFIEAHPEVAMACGQLLNSDGSKQNSIANFPSFGSLLCNESCLRLLFPKRYPSKYENYVDPIPVESCVGACLMVRKTAMEAVGLLDERYFFFFEETDWAKSMKDAGWQIFFVPSARIFHFQGQTVGHDVRSRFLFYRSRYMYLKKWHRRSYVILCMAIFLRLLANAFLNLIGVVGTLGLHAGTKKRLDMYARLIAWHVKGCPEPSVR